MKRDYRRRNYFVKRGFQGRFILKFVIVSVIGFVLAIGLLNFLAYRKLDVMQYKIHIFSETTGQLLIREILYANLFALVMVVFLFIFITMRIFWKLNGPLYRIRTDLGKISHGDLSFHIVLRGRDEFADCAQELNGIVESFRRRFKDIKGISGSLIQSAGEMEKAWGEPDILARKNQKMMEDIKVLEQGLKAFDK